MTEIPRQVPRRPVTHRLGLQVTVVIDGPVATIGLRGDVDLALSDHLRRASARTWSPMISTVAVDLAEVTFMDSTGLSFIASLWRAARSVPGRRVVLVEPSTAALRPLQICGFTAMLDVVTRAQLADAGRGAQPSLTIPTSDG